MDNKETLLYLRVKEQILQRFLEMDISAGDKLPAEAAMVEMFAASRSTIKRAINCLVDERLVEQQAGSGTYVLPKMVELRREMLAKERGKRIALVLPDLSDRYSYRVLRGICRQLEQYRYSLELYNTFGSIEKEKDALKRVLASEADGVLFWPTAWYSGEEFLHELIRKKTPVVFVDHTTKGLELPCIMSDHVYSGHLATTHLLKRGHRHIAFFARQGTLASSQHERVQGYEAALDEWGVGEWRELYTPSSQDDELTGELCQYFEQHPELTAVICSGGMIMRVTNVLKQLGKRVPEDMSLVCFDGFENAEHVACPPTYIQQAEEEIGRNAVKLLYRLFREPEGEWSVTKIPVTLSEGGTVRTI